MEQSPLASSQAGRGTEVVIVISTGPIPRSVPSVAGKTQETATVILEQQEFVVALGDTVASTEVPAGSVVSQNPEANTQVARGATVTIVVSTGAPMAEVPSLNGLSADAAATLLDGRGLAFVIGEFVTDPQRRGLVVEQAVPAGTSVPVGTTIAVKVGI